MNNFKLVIQNGYLIEAIRHDENQSLFNHLVDDCDWQLDDASDCSAVNDFYILEIKATDITDLDKTGSAYLGAMIAKDWIEDTKQEAGGYLPQMIEEAMEEAKQ